MNIQLFTLQTVLIIIAWFVTGAMLDFITLVIAIGGNSVKVLLGTIINTIHSTKVQLFRGNLFLRAVGLVLAVIELFFMLLNLTFHGSFVIITYLFTGIFFIPYLITRTILRIFKGEEYYQEFLGNLLNTTVLQTESNDGNNSPSIHIEGNATSGKIVNNAGRDINKYFDREEEPIDLIGSSDGHRPINSKDEVYIDLKKVLNEIGRKYFKISIGHPELISKGIESPFVVQLYFEELTNRVKMKIKEIVGESYIERVYDTELKFGKVVKIKLYSPDITFPEPIAKKLDTSINSMIFLGKPLDTCQPREHKVVLSILDNKTGIEYQSETFSVRVADYAFDHVSRPLLSKVSAFALGIGSFAMFVLALLEQIDKTIGLTSGTAAGVLAVVVYTNFYNLYQRIRPNNP